MRRLLKTLALCLLLFTAGARADQFTYLYVSGVESLRTPIRIGGSNLAPWERQKSGDEIYISNSCGFAKVTYRGTPLSALPTLEDPDTLRPMSIYVRLGEWCRVGEYIFENPHLLRLRSFGSRKYLESFAVVFTDVSERAFVASPEFIAENGLEALAEDIPRPTEGTGCYTKQYAELADLVGRHKLAAYGDQYCYQRGVYLSRLR